MTRQSPRSLSSSVFDFHIKLLKYLFCLEPVCAIGMGVAALCCDKESSNPEAKWASSGYSMTAV